MEEIIEFLQTENVIWPSARENLQNAKATNQTILCIFVQIGKGLAEWWDSVKFTNGFKN